MEGEGDLSLKGATLGTKATDVKEKHAIKLMILM